MKAKFSFKSLIAMAIGLLVSVSVYAQEIVVSGSVLDDLGEPVLGANVIVKGTSNGATTDMDGNFTLKAPAGSTLVVSFIGYSTQEVAAAPNMKITLKEDSELLDDVVVIGYGVAKKNDMTGSVTAIKPDEKNKPLVTSAQEMMQGKIAGVSVTTGGGTPGGGATIRVRGGSSLNASNDPLIVIDGLAVDAQGVKGSSNALSMVNPNDIESFTVLKDASATAIYGSRGSNGVIIITTKKGRKGMKAQISYSGNVSVSTVTKKFDVLSGDEYRNFVNTYYGPESDAAKLMGDANTDWQDEIYRTAVSTDHNITVQGGLKNMPYRVSVGYTNQNGIVKTSNYQRTTASANLNPSFLEDHLKFNVNAKYVYTYNRYANGGAISNSVRMDPTQPVRTSMPSANFNDYFAWTSSGKDLGTDLIHNSKAPSNPVAILDGTNDRANSHDFLGNVEVDYQIHGFEDLRIHANLSGDWATGTQDTDVEAWNPNAFFYGSTGYTTESKYNLIATAYVQYYKDFSKNHHFDIMAGYEWNHLKYHGDNLYYQPGFVSKKGWNDVASVREAINSGKLTETGNSMSEWKQENYLVSFYGRMNYIAFDRYMFTATVRRDGSSRFQEHWATFPSVALGWKINEEAFMKDVNWLDELKLRAGWGMTGQQEGIGNYNYFTSYNVNELNNDGRYPIKGIEGNGLLSRPDAFNKELKWETTTTWNGGIDFAVLRNKLSLNLDVYYRKTTDLINDAFVPAGTNFSNMVKTNIGSLENKGVEASVTYRPIQTSDWQWEVTANFAYNKNKIIELTGESSVVKTGGISAGTGNTCQVHKAGEAAGSFYVYQQVYDEAGKPIEGVYVDRNADGKISEEDLYVYKNPAAPYQVGLSSRLQYKNWDLGFSLRGNFGNYAYNDRQAGYVNVEKRYDSSFGCLQNVTNTAIENNWQTYDHVLSDYFVQNASFVKLDNISLGYSFENLFKGKSYKGLGGRIYLTATNVATITKYKGLDPENGGIDNNIYPRPFSMTLGLNINF